MIGVKSQVMGSYLKVSGTNPGRRYIDVFQYFLMNGQGNESWHLLLPLQEP